MCNPKVKSRFRALDSIALPDCDLPDQSPQGGKSVRMYRIPGEHPHALLLLQLLVGSSGSAVQLLQLQLLKICHNRPNSSSGLWRLRKLLHNRPNNSSSLSRLFKLWYNRPSSSSGLWRLPVHNPMPLTKNLWLQGALTPVKLLRFVLHPASHPASHPALHCIAARQHRWLPSTMPPLMPCIVMVSGPASSRAKVMTNEVLGM